MLKWSCLVIKNEIKKKKTCFDVFLSTCSTRGANNGDNGFHYLPNERLENNRYWWLNVYSVYSHVGVRLIYYRFQSLQSIFKNVLNSESIYLKYCINYGSTPPYKWQHQRICVLISFALIFRQLRILSNDSWISFFFCNRKFKSVASVSGPIGSWKYPMRLAWRGQNWSF